MIFNDDEYERMRRVRIPRFLSLIKPGVGINRLLHRTALNIDMGVGVGGRRLVSHNRKVRRGRSPARVALIPRVNLVECYGGAK